MQQPENNNDLPNPQEILTLGQEEYYRRYYSDSSKKRAYFGLECDICENDFHIPRTQFVHAVDNGSTEYEQLRTAGFKCLYDDGEGRPPTLLQNLVESSEQFKDFCRITDPDLAKAQGW